MTAKTWTLTDVDQDQYVDSIRLCQENVGGPAGGYLVTKRTLRGGLRDGVDVIEVKNGRFRFLVVPTRGMSIWKAVQDDLLLGWESPVRGPVHPSFVRLDEASGIGWLDGFDEFWVRCGLESNGAPEKNPDGSLRYGLHGKIANIPAHKVEVTIDGESGEICIRGVVDEARMFGNKLRMTTTITTHVGRQGLTVRDEITNISAQTGEMELLYHINVGSPMLSPGAKVVLPVAKLAPRDQVAMGNVLEWDAYGPESPGSVEAVFFVELAAAADGQTQAMLVNAAGDQAMSLKFNKRQLPCFSLWKNRQAAADGYVTGLEPATNYPNPKSFEKRQGRVVMLAPGESRVFEIALEALTDAQGVARAAAEVARLQGPFSPKILPTPDPAWSQG
jgi:hypothetical protein